MNRTTPKVKPVPAYPVFSRTPTREEIFRARVFSEPLVPVGGEPTDEDNRALAAALNTYLARGNDDGLEPLEQALKNLSQSRWRPSLLANLGVVYQKRGYFTKGMAILREAFDLTREEEEPLGRAVADQALGSLLDSYLAFGKLAELDQLLEEIQGRDVRGSATEKVAMAREGAWILRNAHESAVASGPMSVERILIHTRRDYKGDPAIKALHADADGTSLQEVADLSARVGLNLQMVFREDDVEVPLPAIVHFKAGHFAALIRKEGGRYLIDDPILGGDIWVTRAALNDETTGYFLLRPGSLTSGWRPADADEAARIRGKCKPEVAPPIYVGDDCEHQNGGSAGGGCSGGLCPGGGSGMAVYSFHSLLANLHLTDTPVGYSPPRGPSARFKVNYNHREAMQPQIFTYSNLGAKWTFDWISFVEDDPANPSATVSVYKRGAGGETHSDVTGTVPNTDSRALLIRTSGSPIRYERRLPDGSVETFAQADGAMAYPRRVFLTEAKDPQGNRLTFTYDVSLRLVAVTDAIGQVSTLSYEHSSDPLKITKVTDPFGRSALFEYDSSDRLTKITDVIGITSQFEYGPGNFIRALTTPYGTTTFTAGQYVEQLGLLMYRWIDATDPLGGKEKLQYFYQVLSLPTSLPAQVPQGFVSHTDLNRRLTLYWDKRAMALYPDDPTKAHAYHWLYSNDPGTLGQAISSTLGGEKAPLENWVFYDYTGSPITDSVGPDGRPSKVGRVLDDGASQIYRYEYNSLGKVTRETDPAGRATIYNYAPNGIDLQEIRRVNGQSTDVLESRTYNAQHRPLTITDAAGKVTTFTYNSAGKVATLTSPLAAGQSQGALTTYTYDTNGYLTTVSGPVAGATTTFTYDGYGRRRTVTNAAGLTLTLDYDALDRITRVTQPDTTYEETVYNRLDAERQRDRVGRWSERFHDALRRPVAIRDPLGGTTTYQWCSCGSLDKIIDANGNATSREYDVQGRLVKETRADSTFTTYAYENTTHRLKTVTDRKGVTTTSSYFVDDRPASKAFSDGTSTVSYTWHPVTGLLASMANGTDTLSWTYDLTDRLSSEASTKNSSTVSYGYDDAGNRTSLSLNGQGFLTYGYDQAHRPTSVTRGSSVFTFGYDTASRRTTLGFPNGVNTTYGYDTESQLTSLAASLSGTPITTFGYVYDKIGNQTQKTTLDWTETYGYDPVSRLTEVTRNSGNPSRWRYVYDSAGNRTTEQVGDAPSGATFNNLNQLVSRQAGGSLSVRGTVNEPATVTVGGKPAAVAPDNSFAEQAPVTSGTNTVAVQATDPSGNVRTNTYQVAVSGSGATYGYDANGNLTSKGEGGSNWVYEWNGLDQLKRVLKDGAEIARFGYDPLGRRVERVVGALTTSYLLDNGNVLRETRSDGTVFKYIHPLRLDAPLAKEDGSGALSYYHLDALDSVVKVTNQSGAVIQSYQYTAWGEIEIGASAPGFSYASREWEPETGLFYFRARYADLRTGRFLSEDPIRSKGSLYAYVRNNPVNRIDPLGLKDISCAGCSPGHAQQVRDGFKGICDLLMKSKCAGAVHRWGLLPCYQDMCFQDNPPQFQCSTRPGPNKCGGQGGPNLILLTPNAFNPKGCLDTNLQGTMAHEMSHVCISGRKQGPGPDCDIDAKTQFGVPYCSDASMKITNERTKDIEDNCSGK